MENKLANQKNSLTQSKISEVISQTRANADKNQNVLNHLKRIFVLLGIGENKIPSKEESAYFVQMYKAAFSLYTLAEIEYAFQLAIKGTINFDFKLYDSKFSVVFVSGLMNKYRDWRKHQPEYQKLRLQAPEETSEQEADKIMKDAIIRVFGAFKQGNDSEVRFYHYDWLNRKKILLPAPELKRRFYAQAETELKKEFQQEKDLIVSPSEVAKLVDSYSGDTKIINRAKELNLKDYFKGLIEMGIDIEETFN